MGTTYSVKIARAKVDQGDEDALKAVLDEELDRINALMSTYRPDSELSRFNRAPVGEWFDVHPDTLEVVELAGELSTLSDGSFDVTVGPLVNLWGFGPDPATDEVPPDDAIEAALARVGFDKLSVGDGQLRRDADIYVDLSAIAKGYAVDRLATLLDAHGYEDYLVEVGGELRARGMSARGTPWRIAIERPDVAQRVPFTAIEVRDMALATSGDYRNYFEVDGQRYSHTIDPSTGRPIGHNLASVTVLAPTAALADGMATAINVMGAERGLALAEARNLAVFVIMKGSEGFIERHSSAFEVYLDD